MYYPCFRFTEDAGLAAIFRSIAVIGDSLSSGEIEHYDDGKRHCFDIFEQSWGQYIARKTGAKVYNFSQGGMSAKWYMDSFGKEKDFFNPKYSCQAYIFALGYNDLFGCKQKVGSLNDISNKDSASFAYYYDQVIQSYMKFSPKSAFFLVTMPKGGEVKEREILKKEHAEFLREYAKNHERCFVIDLYKYAPRITKQYKKLYYLSDHLNPMGYKLTADIMCTLIDHIIINNPEPFKRIGLVTNEAVPDLIQH